MKNMILLVSVVVVCFSFGDTNHNSFSQENKQEPLIPAPSVRPDEKEALKQELKVVVDSLFIELDRTKAITEERKVLVGHQETNKEGLRQLNQLVQKTLVNAQMKSYSMPVILRLPPIRTEPVELPVGLKRVHPDTFPQLSEKRTIWDKIFFRNND